MSERFRSTHNAETGDSDGTNGSEGAEYGGSVSSAAGIGIGSVEPTGSLEARGKGKVWGASIRGEE